jgi:hypothetical protein
VTDQFEGTGDVLGLQLTRGIINTVLAVAKATFAHEFPHQMKANRPLLVTFPQVPYSDNAGGLNGSMQHLLEVSLNESRRLISCLGINSNKTKALYWF